MKKNPLYALGMIIMIVFCIHFFSLEAFASEGGKGWRPTYDLVMKYLNFGILVFIIVRFGKTPLMNFLHGQKENIAQEIKIIEDQKKEADVKTQKTLDLINKGELHIATIKQKITDEGERKKQAIIEDAKKQSNLIIEKSKSKVENWIYTEKQKLRTDLIDSAINIAMEKLPNEITEKDNQKLLDNFLAYKFNK